MGEPPPTFDALAGAVGAADIEPPILARAIRPAGRAGRSLAVGFELTGRLYELADDHARGEVRLPRGDIERFGSDLLETSPGGRPESGPLCRLVRFEVERAHGLLDASITVIGPLPLGDRLRVSWLVGDARARLQAIARHPDVFSTPPKPWAMSKALGAFRTLRRAHHRRSARPRVG